MADNDNFLSRWSRRKVQVQQGLPVAPVPELQTATAPVSKLAADPPCPPTALATTAAEPAATKEVEAPPPPTLEEALQLSPSSDDFSRFVGRGVDPQVRHTALKTLFSDPHFNVMDGLDTYIDDYNTPDPLPAGMLRKMVQSTMLGLFDDEPENPHPPVPPAPQVSPAVAAAPTTDPLPLDEDPAVRLQPNDDAGPAGDQPGLVPDPGRQQ